MKSYYVAFAGLILSSISFSQSFTFVPKGIGGGGALFAPSISSVNDNEFFVGCDMSELFRTVDFGNSYSQKHFQSIQGGHNSTVRFTHIANILYCIDYRNDLAVPVRSMDGGNSWTMLPGNPDASEETFSIHVDFNNSNRVLISYYNQIYFSSNSGTNFTLIHTAANSGSGIIVGGVFFDGNNIYIGTNDGLIVSANGGTNFSMPPITGIPSPQAIFSFAGAKQGGITRFFCLTANANNIYAGMPGSDYWGTIKGVYSLDYGTGNWIARMNGINVNTDFMMFVGMAQNDISTAYLAGSNSNGVPDVMKTLNGGGSWNHIFNTTNNQNISTGWCGSGGDRGWGYAECPFGFAVSPVSANKLLFTDFGFVHTSINGGVSWKQSYLLSSDQNPAGATTPVFKAYRSIGLENSSCWNMLWIDATHILSAFSDIKGLKSDDAGVTWKMAGATTLNSTYHFLKNPSNGNLYAATSSIHDMYQTTRLTDAIIDPGDGDIMYSLDNGLTWIQLHDFNHPVIWIALDPNNANRMYASVVHYAGGVGEGGIWKTDNLQNGSTSVWSKLTNPPRTEGHPFNIHVLNDGTLVCSYSGRRNASGTFTSSSGVFKMNPGSSAWTDVSDAGMLYYTKDLVIDPHDASQNKWYACVWSGWGGAPNGLGGLYKTVNRGQTWTKIFSGADRVSSITFSPVNPNEIWMTTETDGLWRCTNINSASPSFIQITAYNFRQPERVFYNPYNPNEFWVTSFGNGMKVANLNATTAPSPAVSEKNALKIYPNPIADKFFVTFPGIQIDRIELYNAIGTKVLEKNHNTDSGKAKDSLQGIEINVNDFKRGIYFVKVLYRNKTITQKVVLK